MPCSACATNVLRSFPGSLEILTSVSLRTLTTRNLCKTRASRFYDARTTPRTLSTATHAVGTAQPSASIDLESASASPINPASRPKRTLQKQNDSSNERPAPADKQEGKETANENQMKESGIHATETLTSLDDHGKPHAPSKTKNSFDKDWWEKNIGKLIEPDRHRGSTKAASRAQNDQIGDESKSKTKPTPAQAKFGKDSDPLKPPPHGKENWQIQKAALSTKFGSTGWVPRKRLSPDTMEGIRTLHSQYPDKYTTPVLADQFKVSPEAIRRILKSKWRPSDEEDDERRERWEKRGKKIWESLSEKGLKPPRKWRGMGVGRGKTAVREPTRRERRMVLHLQREKGNGGKVDEKITAAKERPSETKSRAVALAGQPEQGLPAISAVRPELGYQMPLADRIL